MVSDTAPVECSLYHKFFQKIDFEDHVCMCETSYSSTNEYPPETQQKRCMTVAPEHSQEEEEAMIGQKPLGENV